MDLEKLAKNIISKDKNLRQIFSRVQKGGGFGVQKKGVLIWLILIVMLTVNYFFDERLEGCVMKVNKHSEYSRVAVDTNNDFQDYIMDIQNDPQKFLENNKEAILLNMPKAPEGTLMIAAPEEKEQTFGSFLTGIFDSSTKKIGEYTKAASDMFNVIKKTSKDVVNMGTLNEPEVLNKIVNKKYKALPSKPSSQVELLKSLDGVGDSKIRRDIAKKYSKISQSKEAPVEMALFQTFYIELQEGRINENQFLGVSKVIEKHHNKVSKKIRENLGKARIYRPNDLCKKVHENFVKRETFKKSMKDARNDALAYAYTMTDMVVDTFKSLQEVYSTLEIREKTFSQIILQVITKLGLQGTRTILGIAMFSFFAMLNAGLSFGFNPLKAPFRIFNYKRWVKFMTAQLLYVKGGRRKRKRKKSKKIRKHKGINQSTGRLKSGYKYSGKKLKSGLPEIVRILKKKTKGGGKVTFNRNVRVEKIPDNDCPPKQRPSKKISKGEKTCKDKYTKFTTKNGFLCCKKKHNIDADLFGEKVKKSKLTFPEMLKPEMLDLKRRERRAKKKGFKNKKPLDIKAPWQRD